jgi:hypothetical protein
MTKASIEMILSSTCKVQCPFIAMGDWFQDPFPVLKYMGVSSLLTIV